jgi:pimeloyl-ACP methyl ester carboxylesterase
MPKVQTNGIQMAYTEQGSGEPLVCIMGVTAPGAVWEAHAASWETTGGWETQTSLLAPTLLT